MIIVDTNVAPELMRPSPAPAVQDWVRARRGDELYTTSITLAEIRCGIERLPAGRCRDLLKATADNVVAAFRNRAATPTTRLWPPATSRTSRRGATGHRPRAAAQPSDLPGAR
jgi:predicted nucleic acid-binding protein